MRICIDLDGVICDFKKNGESYADVRPIPGAVEKLHSLKNSGHYIIIQTARHMKTCDANIGRVNAKVAKITLDWLESHDVPYDEIFFGKPWANVYIDDNALRFAGWDVIEGSGTNLPLSNEIANPVQL